MTVRTSRFNPKRMKNLIVGTHTVDRTVDNYLKNFTEEYSKQKTIPINHDGDAIEFDMLPGQKRPILIVSKNPISLEDAIRSIENQMERLKPKPEKPEPYLGKMFD